MNKNKYGFLQKEIKYKNNRGFNNKLCNQTKINYKIVILEEAVIIIV